MELTAIMLGLAGSLHCAFMCSPLAVAVTSGTGGVLVKRTVYNLGRIFTYSILGLIVTAVGAMVNLTDFHLIFTIFIGLALIGMGIAGLTTIRVPFITPVILKFSGFVKALFGKFLQRRTLSSVYILGMLNGLLPCGMTYLALTYCLTLSGPLDGFSFMILFGIGTLPAMLGITAGISHVVNKFNFGARNLTRFGFIFLGVLVLARLFLFQGHPIDHKLSAGAILFCQ